MGCFTSIIHPKDGRELQIKTYRDCFDTYRVGDTVRWKIYDDLPGIGTLLDGVYLSYSIDGPDDFVVIKNHQVLAVKEGNVGFSIGGLATFYEIIPWEREWWPEDVWLAHDIRLSENKLEELRRDLKQQQEYHTFLHTLKNLSVDNIAVQKNQWFLARASKLASEFIRKNLDTPRVSNLLFRNNEICESK